MAFQALRAVFGRRGVTGIALLAVAALILLSLVSYSPADPVLLLKSGTGETVANWLGPTRGIARRSHPAAPRRGRLRLAAGAVPGGPAAPSSGSPRRRRLHRGPGCSFSRASRSARPASLRSPSRSSLAKRAAASPGAASAALCSPRPLSGAMNPLGAGVVLGGGWADGLRRAPGMGFQRPRAQGTRLKPPRTLDLPTLPPASSRGALGGRTRGSQRRRSGIRASGPFVGVASCRKRKKPDPETDPAKEPVPVARPRSRPDLLKKPLKPGTRPAPGGWKLPSLQLLTRRAHQPAPAKRALEERRKALEAACLEHGVRGQVDRIQPGPVVTTFEFRLGEGETLKKIPEPPRGTLHGAPRPRHPRGAGEGEGRGGDRSAERIALDRRPPGGFSRRPISRTRPARFP